MGFRVRQESRADLSKALAPTPQEVRPLAILVHWGTAEVRVWLLAFLALP